MKVDVEHAAALLLEQHETGGTIPDLPDGLRPATMEEAYAIQDALHRHAGWDIGVLKVGDTTPETQRNLGIDHPIAGRVPQRRVHVAPARLDVTSFHHPPLLEGEFGLRIGRPIGPDEPLDADGIARCVDAVVPAIELLDTRFDVQLVTSAPSLVADNSAAAAVVLGAPVPVTSAPELVNAGVRLEVEGSVVGEGTGSAALGDPLESLAWIVGHEQRRGRGVAAGTVVITGSCTGAVPCVLGAKTVADFGPLGVVHLTIGSGS